MVTVKHAILAARIARQQEEALGSDNRLFFFEHYGREPVDDDELMMYYADPQHGGAAGFKKRLDEKEAREMEAAMEAQRQEALSEFNLWVTGEEVHHPPNPLEAEDHWRRCGGLEAFRNRIRLAVLSPHQANG